MSGGSEPRGPVRPPSPESQGASGGSDFLGRNSRRHEGLEGFAAGPLSTGGLRSRVAEISVRARMFSDLSQRKAAAARLQNQRRLATPPSVIIERRSPPRRRSAECSLGADCGPLPSEAKCLRPLQKLRVVCVSRVARSLWPGHTDRNWARELLWAGRGAAFFTATSLGGGWYLFRTSASDAQTSAIR